MHSARILMATAAASAVLALGASGAYAAGDDWDHSDSSYSKEQGKEHGKEHGKDSPHGGMHTGGGALTAVNEGDWGTEKGTKDGEHGKEHGKDSPHGGMHTGGGALTAVNEGDWGTEKGTEKGTKDGEHGKDSGSGWSGKQEGSPWSSGHEKPSGGMHTGGGALASPTVTAGGLAVLAVAATGLYAARRRNAAGSVA